jgi:predicted nuclease of restriction endonuclease-like (RecB) superfamily
MASLFPDVSYTTLLRDLKTQIRSAQGRASLAVNRELILLYWQIGQVILQRQDVEGWGAKVITQLAKDLRHEFPDMKGLSRSNLMYMRSFAEAYPDRAIVQQLAGQIPWFHNCSLMDKVKDPVQRIWYIQKTIENGWSRNVLLLQIESNLYQRQGGATTNFAKVLPSPQSDLAQQVIKDPYCFDFLTIGQDARELELENALVANIRDFLLELGVGFSFVGSQYPIEVGNQDYRLDLLFYHTQLRCYVVIDLKMGRFEPEFAGKMNFYVAAVDDLLRHPDDQPTIGMILCGSRESVTAEYSLRNINTPIAVATHQLPSNLRTQLPSVEQLEMMMESAIAEPSLSDDEPVGPRVGKRSDPNYKQITAYISVAIHKRVKLLLLEKDEHRDFSELIQDLLDEYLKNSQK